MKKTYTAHFYTDAEYASTAIEADWDDSVKNLLCDLMHFCDRRTFEDGKTCCRLAC